VLVSFASAGRSTAEVVPVFESACLRIGFPSSVCSSMLAPSLSWPPCSVHSAVLRSPLASAGPEHCQS